MRDPEGTGDLAGIMDARAFLTDEVGAQWSTYWETDATVAKVKAPGGSVVNDPQDSPLAGWPRFWIRRAPCSNCAR